MADYDAIVIGAGISGLTAAAYLARGGARVLVCEQAGQVGGLFNSFWQEGYLFDGGIKAVENAGILIPMLAELGLLSQVRLHKSPVALITEKTVHPIRSLADVEAYFQFLAGHFPDQKVGLQRVLDDVLHIGDLLGALVGLVRSSFEEMPDEAAAPESSAKDRLAALGHLPATLMHVRAPLRRYLGTRLSNPSLVNLLSHLFPDGTGALFGLAYFSMFLDYYYPEDGIQAVPTALAGGIEAAGGEILLNTPVARICLEHGRASGVALADGTELRASHVVAAGDARQTFTQLMPAAAVPPSFTRKLLAAAPSHSVFAVFLGLDIPVEQLNLQGCGHLFYAPDLTGIGEADRDREDYFARVPQELSVPCLRQASLAPRGKTGLILSALTSWRYAHNWGLNAGKPSEAYRRLSEKLARQMVASLETFIPGLSHHVDLCVTATPYTLQQRTSNFQGAIMGWSYDREKAFHRTSLLRIARSVETPVPNLLMAGHWSFSPGGSPVAVLTGKLAARKILRLTRAGRTISPVHVDARKDTR